MALTVYLLKRSIIRVIRWTQTWTAMSARIDILTPGYADMVTGQGDNSGHSYMRATGSCCLVRSGGHNILFDTMGPWEKEELISKLTAMNLHVDNINYLVCSHSHPDHIGNLNLFTRAKKHFIGTSVYTRDVYDLNCFEPTGSCDYATERGVRLIVPSYQAYALDGNLSIEPSPGHTMECVSLIINNCDNYGKVALAGDLFEREEDILDEGVWLGAGSQNADLQRANRSRVYNEVDYILPGHGPLFKTTQPKPIKF